MKICDYFSSVFNETATLLSTFVTATIILLVAGIIWLNHAFRRETTSAYRSVTLMPST
jgi:hypothetical protein